MQFKRTLLALFVLVLCAGTVWAQTPVVTSGWEAFVIRENATEGAPLIEYNDAYGEVAVEFVTFAGSQKAGLGTNQINGATLSQIATLHVDRLDDPSGSGSEYGPYFNIWVTDGAGQYAVIANEPSDAEWAGNRWDVSDWAYLSTKRAKVYEVPGAAGGAPGTSWVATYATNNGWDGVSPLTFADVAGLEIAPPPASYIQDPANAVSGGAPRELGTDVAYGYNWIFGDTLANYVSGDEGFVVNNYYATTVYNVANTTQGTTYATIEAALADANAGDIITVADGTYNPVGTLSLAEAVTLTGASQDGTIINIPAAGGYGFIIRASNVTLQNFTMNCDAANENYPIHASGTNNLPNGYDNLVIENFTIQGAHRRAGFDIHGFNNVDLSGLVSSGAWGGNGIQITGCTDVDMDNITCTDNVWGSIAIYCSNTGYLGRGSDDVTIDAATLTVDGAVFSQDEFGFTNTNIDIDGWDYAVTNSHFREAGGNTDSEGYTFFVVDQAAALAMALGFTGYEEYSAMENLASDVFEVVPGLTIQAAIDEADSGDTIEVAAGNYEEQLHVSTENLTLMGAGKTQTFVDSPENLTLFYTTSADNYPIVFVDGVSAFTMTDLTVDGMSRGNNNYRFQGIGFWNSGGSVTDVDVVNVIDIPFSGSQHGVGIYAYNDTGGPYTVNLTRVEVGNYQKGGIALNGDGLTAHVVDCVTTGHGATDVTAQNGIQFYGGLGGTISGCSVTGNIYTGGNWAASGILMIAAGQVEITNTTVVDGDPAVYCQETSATVDGLVINNNDVDSGNGYYSRISSALAKAADGDMAPQADASPFGDFEGKADGAKGIATVNITNSTFTGQGTGYGVSCSNYVAADLIDITVTNSTVKNWGWGVVLYASGGEVAGHFTENGFIDNGGFFYAFEDLNTTQEAWGNVWGTNNPEDLIAAISGDVVYSPWLAGGAEGAPGFTGDHSVVHVDDDGNPAGTTLIQDGIALVSGSTVNIAPGLYTEAGQIVIDEDLNLIGDAANRPVIMTSTDTGGSGDARGWFLQSAGTHLVMQNLELDGAGHNIYQALRAMGSGVVDNVAFRNITYPSYAGVAIAAFGAVPSNWDITNCSFDNIGRIGFLCYGTGHQASTFIGNTYTGKGPGDWLDYACDISAGANLTVEGNTITACQGVASSDGSDSAALLVSTYFAGGTTAAINNNVLTGNSSGVAVGYDAADVSTVSGHGNTIAGNDNYGVYNTGANPVDFLGNWWGDSTGPFHPTLNASGLGNEVGDNVLFDPWTNGGTATMDPTVGGPISCGDDATLTVNLTTGTMIPDVFGFTATVRASAGVDWAGITNLDAFGSTTQFLTFDNGDGSYLISGTTLGNPTQPISGAGVTPLFSMTFTGLTEGVADITFEEFLLRDSTNQPINAAAVDGTIVVDCTAPPAVADIAATPDPTSDDNGVEVSWTVADNTDVDHYEIWRAVWHTGDGSTSAYPEYDDINPTEPVRASNHAVLVASGEWTMVTDTVLGTATSYIDLGMDRGVYYYEVVAVDAAGNIGPLAAANDRATSYYLGDFDGNGVVNGPGDLTPFGTAFGTTPSHALYNAETDIGRTDDWSGLGIPTTDNYINFEDLMILSLNYGVVGTTKSDARISEQAVMAWVDFGDNRYGLRLLDADGLKGVHLRATLPEGASVTVVEGDLLKAQGEPTFLRNLGNGVDVSAAVLGRGVGFDGQGDLFIVECSHPLTMEDLAVDLRGADNGNMEVSLTSESGTMTPRVFGLYDNYPNPFNPMTKISFSLPEEQPVRLNVYGIDGRLVRQLVNETRGAGMHEVIWDGRSDSGRMQASGLYFYRIEAGPYSQVHKMTLMK